MRGVTCHHPSTYTLSEQRKTVPKTLLAKYVIGTCTCTLFINHYQTRCFSSISVTAVVHGATNMRYYVRSDALWRETNRGGGEERGGANFAKQIRASKQAFSLKTNRKRVLIITSEAEKYFVKIISNWRCSWMMIAKQHAACGAAATDVNSHSSIERLWCKLFLCKF